ncbi:hypothetical protein PVW46_16980 [Mameliella sp. AT18]|uniref:phage head-tail joining protein n=1 Tax=Mameliella sp. AT18 TaxID=3028385 RepID=UPI0008411917|nr:hypothetical protein [Mameliella sp. AT18]MDD9731600.1 hypothetical protein [Mameliella sp. AT18]ODM46195.1 hypothetical protein A9320_26715 [Ruegeria sp. PBVC088]
MAVTASEAITKLETAMAQGVREVTYSDGRSVKYANQAEMERAIAYWRGQQRISAGLSPVTVSIGAMHRG